MAEIFTPNGLISIKSQMNTPEPNQSTLVYIRQFARAYSPLFGGYVMN